MGTYYWEVPESTMSQREQRSILERQDFVDTAIHNILELLTQRTEWDIEDIGAVRDAICAVAEKYGISEKDIYPSPCEDDDK